jgi:hypothetical protein
MLRAQGEVLGLENTVKKLNLTMAKMNANMAKQAALVNQAGGSQKIYQRRTDAATRSTNRMTFSVRMLGNSLGRMGSIGIRSMGALSLGMKGAAGGVALMTSSFATLMALVIGSGTGLLVRWSADFRQNMIEVMTIVKETEGTLEGLTKKVMEMSRASGIKP